MDKHGCYSVLGIFHGSSFFLLKTYKKYKDLGKVQKYYRYDYYIIRVKYAAAEFLNLIGCCRSYVDALVLILQRFCSNGTFTGIFHNEHFTAK